MRAFIFCGGTINNYTKLKNYLGQGVFICADGGAKHLKALSISPDWLVGDFDSIEPNALQGFRENGVKISQFHTRKDYTDGEIAVEKALEIGSKEILIFGATGGRMDHTLANLYLLQKIADHDVRGMIVTEKQEMICSQGMCILEGVPGEIVSIIALDEEVKGISTEGLEYPLKDESLFRASTRGMSNVFRDQKAIIRQKSGALLVIKSLGKTT